MATEKLSVLPEVTAPNSADLLVIVNGGVTSKIRRDNLLAMGTVGLEEVANPQPTDFLAMDDTSTDPHKTRKVAVANFQMPVAVVVTIDNTAFVLGWSGISGYYWKLGSSYVEIYQWIEGDGEVPGAVQGTWILDYNIDGENNYVHALGLTPKNNSVSLTGDEWASGDYAGDPGISVALAFAIGSGSLLTIDGQSTRISDLVESTSPDPTVSVPLGDGKRATLLNVVSSGLNGARFLTNIGNERVMDWGTNNNPVFSANSACDCAAINCVGDSVHSGSTQAYGFGNIGIAFHLGDPTDIPVYVSDGTAKAKIHIDSDTADLVLTVWRGDYFGYEAIRILNATADVILEGAKNADQFNGSVWLDEATWTYKRSTSIGSLTQVGTTPDDDLQLTWPSPYGPSASDLTTVVLQASVNGYGDGLGNFFDVADIGSNVSGWAVPSIITIVGNDGMAYAAGMQFRLKYTKTSDSGIIYSSTITMS